MANTKFSQFTAGNQSRVGDTIVGLRGGVNYKFDFPSNGIQDTSGNYLFGYSSAGVGSVNYLELTNAISGNPAILSAVGTDTNVSLTIEPKGTGHVHIPAIVDQLTELDVGNFELTGNIISSTNSNGNISISPNGTGYIELGVLQWPTADGAATQVIGTDGAGHLGWETVTTFSGSSTNDALARFNGVAGAIQNSGVILDNSNNMTGVTSIAVGNLSLATNVLSSTNTNGNIVLTPNGSGTVQLIANYWPIADGTTGQVISTNGAGTLSFINIDTFAGPSTDNAIARFDGTAGQLQNSGVLISDANAITGATDIAVGNLDLTGNTISTTNTNGNMNIALNGSGTWTINSTVGVVGIINDNTFATAASNNLATALSIKNYVNSISSGFSVKAATAAATTANLSATYANGTLGVGATLTNNSTQVAFAVDGYSASTNDRILVKNQSTSAQNGIYTVTTVGSGATNWVLTRATDYNVAADVKPGDLVIAIQGTTQAGSSWLQTATVTTMGTDPITFIQFSASIPVSLGNGGTGASLTASTGGIFYSGASAGAILAGTATANQMLQSGSSAAPAWSTATWPATTSANRILYSSSANTVGQITSTAGGVLITNSSSVPSFLTNPSSTGNILQSASGGASTWSTATYPATAGTSGTLLTSNGTNIVNTTATYPGTSTNGSILIGDGTNWNASTATWPNTTTISQLLYSSSANTVAGLATANNAILTTNGSGVPSWTAGVFPITWSNISGTSQSAAVNSGYVIGNASQTNVTLPATAALGSIVAVQGKGAAGWVITANTGQTIQVGGSVTSTAGSVTSSNQWDAIELVCVTANTVWATRFVVSSGVTLA